MTSGLSFVTFVTPPSRRGSSLSLAMSGIPLGVLLGPPLGGLGADRAGGGSGVFGAVALLAFLEAAAFGIYFQGGSGGGARREQAYYCEHDEAALDSATDDYELESEGSAARRSSTAPIHALAPSPSPSSSSFFSRLSPVAFFSRLPPLTSLSVSLVLLNTCIAVTEPLCPLYLSAPPFAATPSEVGIAFSAMSISYLIATPLAGILVDRLKMYTPPLYLGLLIAGFGLALVFVPPPLCAGGSVWPTTIPGLVLLGIGVALADACAAPLAALLCEWGPGGSGSSSPKVGGGKQGGVGEALGGVDSAVNVGFLLGPMLAVLLGGRTGEYKVLGAAWGGASWRSTPSLGGGQASWT